MLEIMKVYKKEIEDYCVENNLSIDKVFSSGMCYDEKSVLIREPFVPEEGVMYMIDYPSTTPASTLEIYLENGKLRFVQTDITRKYLADHAPAPQIPHAETGKFAFA
jgi:tRNA(Ile)-lysidine synthase TilS/MesJ